MKNNKLLTSKKCYMKKHKNYYMKECSKGDYNEFHYKNCKMAELRWNPFIKDWVMIASHRQNRPQMPKDWCPFCPGSGNVPDIYDVYQ